MQGANQSQTSHLDSDPSRSSIKMAKPLNVAAAQKFQQDAMNKSSRSVAKSESAYESPQKTARSERSAGSKSPAKKGKSGKKKKKTAEDTELVDLFPEMEEEERIAKKRLLNTQAHGIALYADSQKPFFRYIPSRALMQRLVRRTTQLPESFETFEPDLSAFTL